MLDEKKRAPLRLLVAGLAGVALVALVVSVATLARYEPVPEESAGNTTSATNERHVPPDKRAWIVAALVGWVLCMACGGALVRWLDGGANFAPSGDWVILGSDGGDSGYVLRDGEVARGESEEEEAPWAEDDPRFNPFARPPSDDSPSEAEVIELRSRVREHIRRASIAGEL